jgi:hypothetical protein
MMWYLSVSLNRSSKELRKLILPIFIERVKQQIYRGRCGVPFLLPRRKIMFNFDEIYKLMLEYLLIVVLTILGLQVTLLFTQTTWELYNYGRP